MKCLVTGAGGFVGKQLAKRLTKDGHEVIGVFSGGEQVEYCSKSLFCGLEGVDWSQLKGVEAVFHQAANNDTLSNDWADMFHTNVRATARLFYEAYDQGCRKFVYASSTAVYGDSAAPYVEAFTPTNPLNVYAKSKVEMELAATLFNHKVTDAQVIGLRYCNVYGPGEEHKGRRMSMIGQMLNAAFRDDDMRLFEFGEQRRDWVYIEDVVDANLAALNLAASGVYNIGSGKAVSFIELWDYICLHTVGHKIVPSWIKHPFPDQYQSHTECNISKADLYLKWQPKHTVWEGIDKYIKSKGPTLSVEP